jgi:hypothetical protein
VGNVPTSKGLGSAADGDIAPADREHIYRELCDLGSGASRVGGAAYLLSDGLRGPVVRDDLYTQTAWLEEELLGLLERSRALLEFEDQEARAAATAAEQRTAEARPIVSPAPPEPALPEPAIASRPAEPRPPSRPKPAPPPGPSIRERAETAGLLGARGLALAGGIVTLLGVVFLIALAANRGWIGAEARVAIAGCISATAFLAGIWVRRCYGQMHAAVAAVGAGIAGGYATLLAAGALYDMVPLWLGLVIAAMIAAVGAVLAVRWSSQTVAALGLVGAIAVPAWPRSASACRLRARRSWRSFWRWLSPSRSGNDGNSCCSPRSPRAWCSCL